MFRSSLILLTLLPVSLEAFVIAPHASSSVVVGVSSVMTTSRLMMTPQPPAEEQEDESSTAAPFYFQDEEDTTSTTTTTTALVDETEEWAPEAMMEDLEQQSVDFNAFMNKIPQVMKFLPVGEIKDKAQAFLEDERVQDGMIKAKDVVMTTKTKVVEFFQDDKVKDATAKAKDVLQDGISRFSQVVASTFGTVLKEIKQSKTGEDKE